MSAPEPIAAISIHENAIHATLLTERINDVQTVNRLKDELIAALTETPKANVILDLNRVKFVSSTGLLVFLSIRRQAKLERVILLNTDPNVREIFILCRLLPTEQYQSAPFEEATTIQDALALCR